MNSYTIDQAQPVLAQATQEVRAAIQAAHPQPDCLPLPDLHVPASRQDLADLIHALQDNLWAPESTWNSLWAEAAHNCAHLRESNILAIHFLLWKWSQLLEDLLEQLSPRRRGWWHTDWSTVIHPRQFWGSYAGALDNVLTIPPFTPADLSATPADAVMAAITVIFPNRHDQLPELQEPGWNGHERAITWQHGPQNWAHIFAAHPHLDMLLPGMSVTPVAPDALTYAEHEKRQWTVDELRTEARRYYDLATQIGWDANGMDGRHRTPEGTERIFAVAIMRRPDTTIFAHFYCDGTREAHLNFQNRAIPIAWQQVYAHLYADIPPVAMLEMAKIASGQE
ncbi:hypothetical protein [Nonomuraea sp. SYSU D8015]|uniref:hypothetical protein n=1 Tax=Nonomuraea sp. SYSU D8015 TaxID=2593644 RepID=UPI001660FF2C|nr:hypothetical protein [Nonomuraea sp. SYSU D8015]